MPFIKKTGRLLVLCLILAGLPPALAGPLPPCVKAVSSDGGNFLVLVDLQLGPGQPSGGREVQQVTLRVFPKERFINKIHKLTSAATYWTDWEKWSVVLDPHTTNPLPGCPLALITDDGEFLVVVNNAPDYSDTALWIYRRHHPCGPAAAREVPTHSTFIKAVKLKEIWPADKFPKVLAMTGATHSGSPVAVSSFRRTVAC